MPARKDILTSDIGWSTTDQITVRGLDLPSEIIGHMNLGDLAFLLLKGQKPTVEESHMFNAVVITLVVAIVTVAFLFWFLNKTRTGKSMRAFSDNEDLALLSGINPERVVMITWIIVAALATIAGTLYGLDKSFKPFTYFQLLLPIFASAIVGGLGNPLGANAGAFVIAFSEITFTYAFKKVFGYILPETLAPDKVPPLP